MKTLSEITLFLQEHNNPYENAYRDEQHFLIIRSCTEMHMKFNRFVEQKVKLYIQIIKNRRGLVYNQLLLQYIYDQYPLQLVRNCPSCCLSC